jgi:single-stranded DNA-binding protein
MIDALIAGTVHGKPAERTASSGKPYATAKIRVPTRAGETLFVNVIAFDAEPVRALLALSEGDSAALAGELTARAYADRDGNPRPSLDLLARSVLTPYHVARKRKAVRDAGATTDNGFPFDDDLPGVA